MPLVTVPMARQRSAGLASVAAYAIEIIKKYTKNAYGRRSRGSSLIAWGEIVRWRPKTHFELLSPARTGLGHAFAVVA